MNNSNIYKNRFQNFLSRDQLWKTLVSDFFQKFIDSNSSVLDLASGYGEFINNISAKYKYAVDINPDSKKFLKGDILFFKTIPKISVDTIFISNFFEHISKEEISKIIMRIKTIIKPGGQVIILQPNIRFIKDDYWMFWDHITPIDDRALKEIFLASGFSLKKEVLKFLPYTTKGSLPQWPWLIKLYLQLPIFWPIFGKQSLLIFSLRANQQM